MRDELSILLVEDDDDTRITLTDVLEIDGNEVIVASSIAEAIELLDASIAIIILDRKLPDGPAERHIPQLRLKAPDAEIVIVTGYADMDSTISAFRSGASDFLLKPINPEALRHTVFRIVQKKTTELKLRKEQRFANRVLTTAEAIVLVLDLKGHIIRFNPYFEKISGWKLDEVQGKDWFATFVPTSTLESIRDVFLLTQTSGSSTGVINAIITRDGSERQIRWCNTTLERDSGEIEAVLAVGVDVTEFVDAQAKVAQSERLAAIGQTMASLAHESRNALQRIQSGLELLELDIGNDPESAKDLLTVKRAAADLNSLLEEIRSFAAPIQLHLVQADLRDVYQRAWRNLESNRQNRQCELVELDHRHQIKTTIDTMRLEQVFRNLFENSLAASSDPATIKIELDQADPQQTRIVVSDNGPGLSKDQCEQIFEPFYTTKSRGTGLGLAIVKRIVDAHQGTIKVLHCVSELGGMSLQITLPNQVHNSWT
ncbi:ATP-binding protein [Rhodopirellula sp. MGV]|uniref:ATP-binding protein n=1 Tax=Rhodopirellula sp. MGV TaxID=2023130 RepID=UPI000B961D11|nr:ATP-binding protein [Rhodopirellula sp. MGV]OYP28917.1 hybrid sensor histidine kinase/response regulator [Rhodopirellula sp. MGV]PNY36967.1 PAS domain S-box protein [Rhodopirellula baltica]